MIAKLWFVIPEIWLFIGAVIVGLAGLSRSKAVRDSLPLVTCVFLITAGIMTPWIYDGQRGQSLIGEANLLMPALGKYVKVVVCVVGVFLAMTTVGLIDRSYESTVESGRRPFDPIRANRGEFYAFFLLSLIGVMLVCNANDLIWLFLALELTSLPTYIMVAMSRGSKKAQEAAVKYFFLGALSAAIFLYGFALLYGATGTIVLTEMQRAFAAQGGLGAMGTVGMLLALLGIGYKIAAAPMHFYAADVYEGAASPVTAFLGFVPKTAGMLAFILIVGTVGWGDNDPTRGLPQPILTMLWMMAVLTMTLGNVGALLQSSVKRMLAYSSIAHSGYMLIGIIAGPRLGGVNAVLFYMLVYGLMNTAAFAVLCGLERRGQEIESMDDLAGLRHRHPMMAAVMAIAAGSLLGVPPLLGFFGKLFLLTAGVRAGHVALVVIALINSAVSAAYYLRLVGLPILFKPTVQSETITRGPTMWPRLAGILGSLAVLVLPIFGNAMFNASARATDRYQTPIPQLPELSKADELEDDQF
jgi:NADH-quinone oxidoreductase subunit N